jgi:tetraacyldisaccharide 4'-kinase
MGFLRKMAWPISLLYGAVVYVRNLLYNHRILKSKSFETPTICVGNLSVGGTGKTPMIEFLISRLQDDHQLAVLSRGYKRKSEGFQLANANSTVDELGDEPFQIYRKFPRVTVAVDADRQNGIAQLQKKMDPSLILLDDAYQHRKVCPSLSILLTTYDNPFFNDWYLPTGSLRDTKSASRRADLIVVTKCPEMLENSERENYERRLKKNMGQEVLFSTLTYDNTLSGQELKMNLEDLNGTEFTLVTGIANPEPLVNHLKERNLVFEHLKFGDHHSFSTSEISLLNNQGLILTTEKDYVRLQGKVESLFYLKIEHQFLADDEEKLMGQIHARIKLYR